MLEVQIPFSYAIEVWSEFGYVIKWGVFYEFVDHCKHVVKPA